MPNQDQAIETLARKVEELSAVVAALQAFVMHLPDADKADFKAANGVISSLQVTTPTLLLPPGTTHPALFARREMDRIKSVADSIATLKSAG